MEEASKKAVNTAEELGQETPATSTDTQPAEPIGTFVAYMDQSSPQSGDAGAGENLTTTAKALDRWFRERQKTHKPPRLLEIPNEAAITNAGPIQLTGNITLVMEDGSISYANHVSLCRCGASKNKPICDERHLDVEFLNSGRIQEASDTVHSERPSKITISCIKDGPITFRGRLRLHNNLGQECVKQRGTLCRCGHSASKPFCDGSHEKVGFRTGKG